MTRRFFGPASFGADTMVRGRLGARAATGRRRARVSAAREAGTRGTSRGELAEKTPVRRAATVESDPRKVRRKTRHFSTDDETSVAELFHFGKGSYGSQSGFFLVVTQPLPRSASSSDVWPRRVFPTFREVHHPSRGVRSQRVSDPFRRLECFGAHFLSSSLAPIDRASARPSPRTRQSGGLSLNFFLCPPHPPRQAINHERGRG